MSFVSGLKLLKSKKGKLNMKNAPHGKYLLIGCTLS